MTGISSPPGNFWQKLYTVNVGVAVANIDFSFSDYPAFDDFKIKGILVPSADAVEVMGRISDDDGTTFETANYTYARNGHRTDNSSETQGTSGQVQIKWTTSGAGNDTGENVSIDIEIDNVHEASLYKKMTGFVNYELSNAANSINYSSCGFKGNTNAITDKRIYFASGNIDIGSYLTFYGRKK